MDSTGDSLSLSFVQYVFPNKIGDSLRPCHAFFNNITFIFCDMKENSVRAIPMVDILL